MSELEHSSPDLVFADESGQPFTTSMVIAAETGNEHRAVLQLVRAHLADLNDVGRVAFEMRPFATAGGTQRREVAQLDEPAAALLITNLRGNAVVLDFRKRLVAGFYAMRKALTEHSAPALTDDEIVHRALTITTRKIEALTAEVAELKPKAEVADRILDATGDLSIRDTAQTLTRAGIKVGERRLFAELDHRGWIARAPGDGRYRVKQSAIETGYMSVIPQSHYHPKTGVLVLDPPQPRVTPKGLQRLLSDYGHQVTA